MTLRELMETDWSKRGFYTSRSKCVEFARRYNYDVRKMLTNKARKDYGHWNGPLGAPPAWWLMCTLCYVGLPQSLDSISWDMMSKASTNRDYTVAEQREQYQEIARLMKIRGITHRTHRPRRELSSVQPRLF